MMPKSHPFDRALRRVALLLLLWIMIVSTVAAQSESRRLTGHIQSEVSGLTPLGRLSGETRLNLALGLPWRNRSALTSLLAQLYDPTSPLFRQYLSAEEFDRRFDPTEEAYQMVIAFVQTNGFVVTGQWPGHLILDVNASVADIERTFHVVMRTYRHPVESREFHAPDVEPSVEAAIPILDIVGLNTYWLPRPKNLHVRPLRQASNRKPEDGSGPNGLYMGNDFRYAYVPGVSLSGAGQILGLFEFDGYYPTDITGYEGQAGLPNVPLQKVLLDGFDGTPTTGTNSGNSEVALDIEMAIAMAPGLSKVVVYEAGPYGIANHILAAMATNTAMKQISCSWTFGSNPTATTEQLFQRFAAQGQSFFAAVGDNGAYSGMIPAPDDDPNITIVGGTALATTGPGGSWVAETTWNGSGGIATGGGISATYSIPSWQTGIDFTENGGSTQMRNIPDVSIVADNILIVADNGQLEGTGGTSISAPLWAGFTALANQLAASQGGASVGFINPAIYALGKSPYAADWFNDITTGNNTNGNTTQFFAVPGFDLCTGWGTPAGNSLLIALASPDPLLISPGRGFVANGPTGGPFDSPTQVFTITNSSGQSINWSVGSIPSWLTASTDSGSLAPGSTATLALSLNEAANNLGPGVNSALVWFTNLTSGVAQNRQFTLLTSQDLVQNGGFEAADFSWWNLAGDNAEYYSFADDGTYSSLTPHSGTEFAALGQSNSVAYLSQTVPTLSGQLYLLSLWLTSPSADNTPNEFLVQWITNGTPNTLFDQVDLGAFDWTNLQFLATASGGNTTLNVGFRNDPGYFGLDDVSVVPIALPQIQKLQRSGATFSFSWNTTPGLVYQVQYRADLVQGTWLNMGNPVTATTSSLSRSDVVSFNSERFYRVGILP
jgi:hypothetical protein